MLPNIGLETRQVSARGVQVKIATFKDAPCGQRVYEALTDCFPQQSDSPRTWRCRVNRKARSLLTPALPQPHLPRASWRFRRGRAGRWHSVQDPNPKKKLFKKHPWCYFCSLTSNALNFPEEKAESTRRGGVPRAPRNFLTQKALGGGSPSEHSFSFTQGQRASKENRNYYYFLISHAALLCSCTSYPFPAPKSTLRPHNYK